MYTNNKGLQFYILKREANRQCVIKFVKSGSVRMANMDNIRAGKVKDLYSPTRYGVGYDGDIVKTPYWKRARELWSNMLKRCYCNKKTARNNTYYNKVIVSARWKCFANFLKDLPKLEGFRDWEQNKGMELDKDIKGDGTVYDIYTCCFTTGTINRRECKNYRIDKIFDPKTRSWTPNHD